ncbi:hypothetical protein K2X05_10955 [bacterium]|nr:hypothetical protein [bacterium]
MRQNLLSLQQQHLRQQLLRSQNLNNSAMLQKHWFWILLSGALLGGLLLLSPSSIEFLFSPESKGETVILDLYGKVEKKATQTTSYLQVEKSTPLASGDTLVTFEDSKVLLHFTPTFWLLPFSKMEFIKNDSRWIGRLIYGEIRQIESKNKNQNSIELIYNDQKITETDFSSSREMIIAPLVTSETETFQEISSNDSPPQNRIEKQIYQTLLLHKKFFQGCFLKYYKNHSGEMSGGQTIFDLLIDVTGTIEIAHVTKTDINDPEYLQCLKGIFARMRFKNFQTKEPLHAIFPLQVDLPN